MFVQHTDARGTFMIEERPKNTIFAHGAPPPQQYAQNRLNGIVACVFRNKCVFDTAKGDRVISF